MGDRIDSKIEDHRRDPDPHPRITKRIDADIAALRAAVTGGGTGGTGGTGAAVPLPGNTEPSPILPISGTKGSSLEYARKDHVHGFDPAQAGIATVDALNAEAAVRAAADEQLNQQKVNRIGNDRVTGELRVGSSKADDQALADGKRRMVVAKDTGVQEAVTKAKWLPSVPTTIDPETEVVVSPTAYPGYSTTHTFCASYGNGAWRTHPVLVPGDPGYDSMTPARDNATTFAYHRALRKWVAACGENRPGLWLSDSAVFPARGCPGAGWTQIWDGTLPAGATTKGPLAAQGGSSYSGDAKPNGPWACPLPDGGVLCSALLAPGNFHPMLQRIEANGSVSLLTTNIPDLYTSNSFPQVVSLFCPKGGDRAFIGGTQDLYENMYTSLWWADPPYTTWAMGVLTEFVTPALYHDRATFDFMLRASANTVRCYRRRDKSRIPGIWRTDDNGVNWYLESRPWGTGATSMYYDEMTFGSVARLGNLYVFCRKQTTTTGVKFTVSTTPDLVSFSHYEIDKTFIVDGSFYLPDPVFGVLAGGRYWVNGSVSTVGGTLTLGANLIRLSPDFTVESPHVKALADDLLGSGNWHFMNAVYRDDAPWAIPVPSDPDRLAIGPNAGIQLIDQAGATKRLMTASTTGLIEALANPGSAGTYGAANKTLVQTIDMFGRVSVSAETPIQIAESQVTNLPTDLVLLRRYAWAIP